MEISIPIPNRYCPRERQKIQTFVLSSIFPRATQLLKPRTIPTAVPPESPIYPRTVIMTNPSHNSEVTRPPSSPATFLRIPNSRLYGSFATNRLSR